MTDVEPAEETGPVSDENGHAEDREQTVAQANGDPLADNLTEEQLAKIAEMRAELGTDPEPDDDPEPEPAPVDDEQGKALERAVKNYSKAVVGALGATLEPFELCPCCHPSTPGLYLTHELSQENVARMKAILGMPSMENYRVDHRYLECATCGGQGSVLTPSKKANEMVKPCIDCKAKGWITHDPLVKEPERAPALDVLVTSEGVEQVEPPAFDPWGRPHGDPDYYRMPLPGVTV